MVPAALCTLLPTDFSRLRESFQGNPTTVDNYVARLRVAFNWISSLNRHKQLRHCRFITKIRLIVRLLLRH
jgi:hypothetical protein